MTRAGVSGAESEMMAEPFSGAALSTSELIAHLRQYLVVIDPFGEVLQIESGFDDFIGYPFDELIGSNAIDVVAPSQADEIAAHFVAGGEHLIRGAHDLFELELIDSSGAPVTMDCLATRVHREDGHNLWMLALTPHFVRAPEQSLVNDYIDGASAHEMASRFAQLRSLTADEGVWIETFILGDEQDGVFTSVMSGRTDSAFCEAFQLAVDRPGAVWNRPIEGDRVSGDTGLLPDDLAELAECNGVQAVTVGVTSSGGRSELCIVGFGSHPQAFDGYVGRMEARSLGLLNSALDRERDNRLLRDAAERDSLTGLANRAAFTASLESRQHDALLYIDIDNFKSINDNFGHSVGDAVLIEVARRMTVACRPSDLVARIGGDEFAVLLRDVDLPMAEQVGRRLVATVAEPMPPEIGPDLTTVSVGLAYATDDLMHDADMAMLRGKRTGRNELVITHGDR